MDDRERRIVLNETLFREVNERVKDISETFASTADAMEVVCECGSSGCVDRFAIAPGEYEALRSNPDHFAIVPGHEIADVERVVSRCGHYDVVEKLPGEAQRITQATDPRSSQP